MITTYAIKAREGDKGKWWFLARDGFVGWRVHAVTWRTIEEAREVADKHKVGNPTWRLKVVTLTKK